MQIETADNIIGIVTLISHISIIFFLGAYFLNPIGRRELGAFISRSALWIGFIVSVAATAGSIFYSNVLGILPCDLCWFQRIFMYPLVLIFAFALWKKDRGILPYVTLISLFGGIVAIYHTYIQLAARFGVSKEILGFCGQTGTVDCTEIYFIKHGYITFPIASLTCFLIIFLATIIARRVK